MFVKIAGWCSRESARRHDFTVKTDNFLIVGALKLEASPLVHRRLWVRGGVLECRWSRSAQCRSLCFSLSLQPYRWSFHRSVWVPACHPGLLYWSLSETCFLRASGEKSFNFFFFKCRCYLRDRKGKCHPD